MEPSASSANSGTGTVLRAWRRRRRRVSNAHCLRVALHRLHISVSWPGLSGTIRKWSDKRTFGQTGKRQHRRCWARGVGVASAALTVFVSRSVPYRSQNHQQVAVSNGGTVDSAECVTSASASRQQRPPPLSRRVASPTAQLMTWCERMFAVPITIKCNANTRDLKTDLGPAFTINSNR